MHIYASHTTESRSTKQKQEAETEGEESVLVISLTIIMSLLSITRQLLHRFLHCTSALFLILIIILFALHVYTMFSCFSIFCCLCFTVVALYPAKLVNCFTLSSISLRQLVNSIFSVVKDVHSVSDYAEKHSQIPQRYTATKLLAHNHVCQSQTYSKPHDHRFAISRRSHVSTSTSFIPFFEVKVDSAGQLTPSPSAKTTRYFFNPFSKS